MTPEQILADPTTTLEKKASLLVDLLRPKERQPNSLIQTLLAEIQQGKDEYRANKLEVLTQAIPFLSLNNCITAIDVLKSKYEVIGGGWYAFSKKASIFFNTLYEKIDPNFIPAMAQKWIDECQSILAEKHNDESDMLKFALPAAQEWLANLYPYADVPTKQLIFNTLYQQINNSHHCVAQSALKELLKCKDHLSPPLIQEISGLMKSYLRVLEFSPRYDIIPKLSSLVPLASTEELADLHASVEKMLFDRDLCIVWQAYEWLNNWVALIPPDYVSTLREKANLELFEKNWLTQLIAIRTLNVLHPHLRNEKNDESIIHVLLQANSEFLAYILESWDFFKKYQDDMTNKQKNLLKISILERAFCRGKNAKTLPVDGNVRGYGILYEKSDFYLKLEEKIQMNAIAPYQLLNKYENRHFIQEAIELLANFNFEFTQEELEKIIAYLLDNKLLTKICLFKHYQLPVKQLKSILDDSLLSIKNDTENRSYGLINADRLLILCCFKSHLTESQCNDINAVITTLSLAEPIYHRKSLPFIFDFIDEGQRRERIDFLLSRLEFYVSNSYYIRLPLLRAFEKCVDELSEEQVTFIYQQLEIILKKYTVYNSYREPPKYKNTLAFFVLILPKLEESQALHLWELLPKVPPEKLLNQLENALISRFGLQFKFKNQSSLLQLIQLTVENINASCVEKKERKGQIGFFITPSATFSTEEKNFGLSIRP